MQLEIVSWYMRSSRQAGLAIALAACVPLAAQAIGVSQAAMHEPAMMIAGQSDRLLRNGLNLKLEVAMSDALQEDDDCDEEEGAVTAAAQPPLAAPSPSSGTVAKSDDHHDLHMAAAEQVQPAVASRVIQPSTISVVSTWEISPRDKTLNAVLARWAATAGWQLIWELPVDYAIETSTVVHGRFDEAVTQVARSMDGAEVPMKAIFYQGNKVLRIVPKGGQ